MAAEEVSFDQEYYKSVITEYGYDESFFEGFTGDLAELDQTELQRLFLCHKGLYDFEEAEGAKAVTTGFGLSGPPHLGTLSQMYRAGRLSQSGYDVQVVLGDLDSYNGKSTPIAEARRLVTAYDGFMQDSEMFDLDQTIIRDQYNSPDVLRVAYLIGRFTTEAQFEDAEEDLHTFYAERGKVDDGMSYRRKLSLNLMLADFFALGQENPEILVMLGIDEHRYVRMGQDLAEQVDYEASGLSRPNIRSLYTPIISGLRGYPKMSKSFPESGIHLAMDNRDIHEAITREPDTYAEPAESVVLQIAHGIGLGDKATPAEAQAACVDRDKAWQDIKRILSERIITFGDTWKLHEGRS